MITDAFIEKIREERELHMLVKNTAGLAAALQEVQKDIEKIKNDMAGVLRK